MGTPGFYWSDYNLPGEVCFKRLQLGLKSYGGTQSYFAANWPLFRTNRFYRQLFYNLLPKPRIQSLR